MKASIAAVKNIRLQEDIVKRLADIELKLDLLLKTMGDASPKQSKVAKDKPEKEKVIPK